jgi:predicted AAA+ superfamily ATPase
LVATHLLKYANFLEDSTGHRYELRYIRDKEGREVDFAILKDGNVTELFECKWSDEHLAPALSYYSEKLSVKRATQLVATAKSSFKKGGLYRQPISYLSRNPLM